MSKRLPELVHTWAIRWRGIVTRDVGTEYEKAESVPMAKVQFQSRYPMRQIVSVTLTEQEA